jgi:hypothetical protein
VSRLNIYNKNKRLNNYARYGFTRFYFWFVNKPTVIALNSVQPELLKSYESSRYNCIPLTKFFGGMGINQIKPKHIKDYLKHRNMKPNTMKRELDIFRSAIRIALDGDEGLIETYDDEGDFSRDYKIAEKVMGYISQFKPKAECRNMTPTHDEFNAILVELPLEVRPFVQLAGLTAYRKTEIRKLQWKDIDLKKRMIYLTETKNGEDRKTPMYRELYRFVKNLYNFSDKNPESFVFYDKNGKPFHQYSLYRRWNSACKRADVIDSSGKHKVCASRCKTVWDKISSRSERL